MSLERPFTRPENCGLAVVEEFYGQPLSDELLDRIGSTPNDQVETLRRRVREAIIPGPRPGFSWSTYEEPDDDGTSTLDFKPWPDRHPTPNGALLHPTAMLDYVPLSRRPRLPLLLLLGPRIVIQDPLTAWSYHLRPLDRGNLEWVTGTPYSKGYGAPQEVLVAILAGLAPLAPLIRAGVVIMAKPDDGYAARWDVFKTAERLEDAPVHPEGVAHALAGLANGTGALPIPESVESYFDPQVHTEPIGWDFPLLDLTVHDALAMRANEHVFFTMHAALVELARAAGRSLPGEPEGEFAVRVRSAAANILPPVEEELQSLVSKGKLFGVVPRMMSGAVRLATGLLPLPTPGAAGAASLSARRVVEGAVQTGMAAEVALRYSTNLRFSGRI